MNSLESVSLTTPKSSMYPFLITVYKDGEELQSEYWAVGDNRYDAYSNLFNSMAEICPYNFIIEYI